MVALLAKNIPYIWCILQLFLPLQRQNSKNRSRTMNIRLEKPQDYREVENLTRETFWNVYRPGCTEHYVLNQFRTNPDFIPELDLVMEEGDGEHQLPEKIIGHVM
jgi:predicted N-acetyltransferase YhbS